MTIGEEQNSPEIDTEQAEELEMFLLRCTGLQSLVVLTSTGQAILSQWHSAACRQITPTHPTQNHPWHSQSVNKCMLTAFLPKKKLVWNTGLLTYWGRCFKKYEFLQLFSKRYFRKVFGITEFHTQNPIWILKGFQFLYYYLDWVVKSLYKFFT